MVFGWVVVGSVGLIRKQKSSKRYKAIFFVVAASLSLLLAGMNQENSSLVIVWFVGVLMMLVISGKAVNTNISSNLATWLLGILFVFSLATATYGMYATFAWTDQYYGLA